MRAINNSFSLKDMAMAQREILVCSPEYFHVSYVINPWMAPHVGRAQNASAQGQWFKLFTHIAERARVKIVPPIDGLPDMVFTANAGLTYGNKAVVSRFRHDERKGEEAPFAAWFQKAGFETLFTPEHLSFEGAGDALFDRRLPVLWVGHGHRSDAQISAWLERELGVTTAALKLVDARFYHLDTCFCPLEGGNLLYYPAAFDAASRALIESLVPTEGRIAVSDEDAMNFACNAVNIGRTVIMNEASSALRGEMVERGFELVETPLSEFMKAGGSAKCLTLRLDEPVFTEKLAIAQAA